MERRDSSRRRGRGFGDQRDKIRRSGTKMGCGGRFGGLRPPRTDGRTTFHGRNLATCIRDRAADRRGLGDDGLGRESRSTAQPTTATNPTTTRASTSLNARQCGRSPAQPIRPMRRTPSDPSTFSVNESRSVTMTISRFCGPLSCEACDQIHQQAAEKRSLIGLRRQSRVVHPNRPPRRLLSAADALE